jgi:hypothetical protein
MLGSFTAVNVSLSCQLCPEEPQAAQFECVACELTACEKCAKDHVVKPRFSHHKILPINKTHPMLCMEHQMELDLFCLTDNTLCCLKCAQFSPHHTEHKIYSKSHALQELHAVILQQKADLPKIIRHLESSREVYMERLSSLQVKEEELQATIKQVCQEIKRSVDAVEAVTTSKISKEFLLLRKEISEKLDTLNRACDDVRGLANISDELLFLQKIREYNDLNPPPPPELDNSVLLRYQRATKIQSMIENLFSIETLNFSEVSTPNLFYLSRGSGDFVQYNFDTGSFSHNKIRSDEIIPRWSGFVLLPDGQILVTGGKDSKDSGAKSTVFKLDPVTGITTLVPSMLHGHSSHVSILVGDDVYVISGKSQQNSTHNLCEVYSIQSNTWSMIAPMNFGRTCAAGVHCKGMIYVFGGYQASVNNTIEKYDIKTDTWTLLSLLLPEKLWQHACYALDPSQILIFGGEGPSDEPHRLSYIFNVDTEKFYACANIPIYSNWLFFWLHVVRRGDSLYSMNKERQILKYNIFNNSWAIYM